MNSLKENTLVKMVYAYLDLFYKLLPLLFLFYILPLLLNIFALGKNELGRMDLFSLLGKEESIEYSSQTRTLIVALNLAIFSAIFFSLKKLRHFIKNVFENNPYCEENGKHLKYIGWMVVIIASIFHLTKVALASLITGGFVSKTTVLLINLGGVLSVVFNPFIILGLFIIVLGEIIIHGVKIKQENDLTV